MERHSREYLAYLESDEWREKRHQALVAADYHCYRDHEGDCEFPIDVHHIRYDNLGNEFMDDLLVVCRYHP